MKVAHLGEVRTHVGDAVDGEALGVVVVVDGDLVVVQVHQVRGDVPQVQLHLRRSEVEVWSWEGRYKATWKREFKLPWRKAGQFILMIKWTLTSRLSIKISLSLRVKGSEFRV